MRDDRGEGEKNKGGRGLCIHVAFAIKSTG